MGLAVLLVIMEAVYVMTGKVIWKDMTQFWGKLFAINFAMGVATGITMEFQFGTNWGYYSHYVGDIFGVPLAIEGMAAFFLESTFVGLFLFGWDRMSKVGHLFATFLMAAGSNLSALWILIANAWMNYPIGAIFNPESMRMEVESLYQVMVSSVAQAKFIHTVSAAYVTGAMFVLSLSCYYLLKRKHIEFAKRSIIVATSFGFLSALSVVVLGDESGYLDGQEQKMKMASIEAMWETEEPPASFTIFGIPDQKNMKTDYALKIPYVMGIIGTRSFDTVIPGIKDLVSKAKSQIRMGLDQYRVLHRLRMGYSTDRAADQEWLKSNFEYIGFALLLKKYKDNILLADEADIDRAALDTVPNVLPIFFSFRVMVACGFYFIILFGVALYYMNIRRNFNKTWLLKLCLISLPLPWIAAELGWIVAEYGRQPWAIYGILPTFMGVSSVSKANVLGSLIGFLTLYTILLIADLYLMTKYAKKGPETKVE